MIPCPWPFLGVGLLLRDQNHLDLFFVPQILTFVFTVFVYLFDLIYIGNNVFHCQKPYCAVRLVLYILYSQITADSADLPRLSKMESWLCEGPGAGPGEASKTYLEAPVGRDTGTGHDACPGWCRVPSRNSLLSSQGMAGADITRALAVLYPDSR